MKQSITRVLSLLLALALAVGLLPMAVLAGGDEETIWLASAFVSYPVAGAHPNLTGLTEYDTDPCEVDEVHFFELDSSDQPIGAFLNENYSFVAGQKYACQVLMSAKPGYRFDSEKTDGYVNNRYADLNVLDSETAVLTVYLTCAAEYCTVTFDANGSKDAPPAPIQVPYGATVWDVIRNFEAVAMPDQPWEYFWDWSLDPFATDFGANYYFVNPVTEDLTLYAMWIPCPREVELYVELPEGCMTDGVDKPTITVPEGASYAAYSDNLYVGLVDGCPHPDLVYCDPLQRGVTYYSRATVYAEVAGQLPAIHLHGAELVSVEGHESWLDIIYSVTPQTGDKLTKASVAINTPRAGQNAIEHHPEVISLTPGVQAGVQGWFDSPELGTEICEDALEGGKTYYALVTVGDETGNYMLSANTLSLELLGKNAELIRMVDLSDVMPNHVGAVVGVTIPRTYNFTVSVKYGGGQFRSDRRMSKWVKTMDFADTEEGPITLYAKAEPGYMFKSWYDATTYETLSKDPVYTFDVDHDVNIVASFVKKSFDDVGAWDYFYEPVMWAVNHDPVITRGVGDGLFGVGSPCTRAQIMTFLWKANDAPDPITTESPFSDVKPGDYYYKAVLWAVENHITRGVGDGRFGANDPCTREQAMTFLWKSKGSPEPQSMENPFTDVDAGSYYCKAVLWASQQTPPITAGMGGGLFGVGVTCTREQIITFLYKVYGPKG